MVSVLVLQYYLWIVDLFIVISTQKFNVVYNCSILTEAGHVPVGSEQLFVTFLAVCTSYVTQSFTHRR